MSERKCKNGWLSKYVEYTGDQESPELFHLWIGISTIAATLEQNVALDWGILEEIYPNLYILLIGGSASDKKSVAIRMCRRILRKAVPKLNFIPKKISPEMFLTAIYEEYVRSGVGAGYVIAGELAFFFGANDRTADLISFLTEGFDEDEINARTQKRGSEYPKNPCINFLGGTTPDYIEGLPKFAVAGGWAGRHIFIYANEERPAKAKPPAKPEMKQILTEDLVQIRALKGKFQMTGAAENTYEYWYETINQIERKQFSLKGYGGRRGTTVLKLAMVLSASESNSLTIEEHHITNAVNLLESTEASFPDALTHGLQIAPVGKLPRIRQIIQKKQPVEWSPLLHASGLTSKELQDILTDLIEQDDIVETQRPGTKGPVRIFSIKKFTMKGGEE